MGSSDPHTPPQAAATDVGDAIDHNFQAMKVLAWRGRLGRLRFLAYGTVAFLIYIVLNFAIGLAMGISGADPEGSGGLIDAIVWVLMIPYLVFEALVTIRRSHDMGWSGWMSLLAFIPLVGLIWLFKSGSPSANRYGAPPPPNTIGVKIAGIFAVAMVFGILAAISIPMYQQYIQRAAQVAQQVPSK